MAILTGGGEYVYEVVENWGKLPDGWNYDVAGVGIDSKNRIFLFNRSERPMIIVDLDGKVLHSWGAIRKRSPTRTPLRWGLRYYLAHRYLRSTVRK